MRVLGGVQGTPVVGQALEDILDTQKVMLNMRILL